MVIIGNAIAQRIKATLGITGLSPQEFTSTGRFGTLDVGSSHPEAEVSPRLGCSPIKAVRELGSERRETVRSPIRCGRRKFEELSLVREEDRMDVPLVCTGCRPTAWSSYVWNG